VRGAY